MRKTDVRPKMRSAMMLACMMVVVLIGASACSPSERAEEDAPSSYDATSSGRIALNDSTFDGSVPLEEASVVVYNATAEGSLPDNVTVEGIRTIEGLAEHGAQKLREMGVEQVTAKNAATPGSFTSYVVYRSPEYAQAAHEIAEGLGITGSVHETGENSATGYYYDGDIAVILCEDWAFSEGLTDELSEKAQQAIDDQKAALSS